MATIRRHAPANLTAHIIVRGHNKMAVFGTDRDCALYVQFMQHAAARAVVAIHAFAILNTHAHVIATPSTNDGIARMMQRSGTRYGRYFNARHERTGAVWAGRYRVHVIDSVRYLLACLRYVDLNAAEAGLVARPADYRWSSYAAHACGSWPIWLTPHPAYLALGDTAAARERQYRSLCDGVISVEELAWIEYVSSHEWRQLNIGVVAT